MSGGRSYVAGVNALFRSVERLRSPEERLLDDPHAARFAETNWRVWLIRLARWCLPPLGRLVDELQTAHCVRHRSIDELVLRAVEDGFRQVIVLGAGYDMRAARFANRLEGVLWIEIDHPETAARKRRLLGDERSSREVVRAPADLERVSIADVLQRTGFRPEADACFVLEGLIHYLRPEGLERVLAAASDGPGRRRIVLSFIREDTAARASGLFVTLVRLMREIPRQHYSPAALEAVCRRAGFGAVETWPFERQVGEFAPQGKGRRARLTQDVAMADRPALPGRTG